MRVALAYLGVIAVWSTTPLGIKYSVINGDELAPLVVRTAVGLLATMLCLAFISARISFSGKHLRVYAASSIGIVGALTLTYYAASYVNSGSIAVMYGLSPIIASLIAVPILGERTTLFQYLAILLGLAGLGWIFRAEIAMGDERWIGTLLLLAAVFCHALSAVLVKRFDAGANPMAINAGSLLVALPILILITGDADYRSFWSDETVVHAILYLGIFGSFFGFVLHFYVLQKLSAIKVMLVPLITPVTALLLGYWIADEAVHRDTLLGTGLILSALGVYFMASKAGPTQISR